MRVIVPAFRGDGLVPDLLHPRVVPAIENQGYTPEVIAMVNEVGNPDSYPQVLRRLFLSGDDFCIIEHDNESRPGFLADLEACPEPWCYFAYDFSVPYEEAVVNSNCTSAPLGTDFSPLGHTRFKGGVGERIRATLDAEFFLSSWVSRDTFVSGALTAVGVEAHRHRGKCFHHHPYHAQYR